MNKFNFCSLVSCGATVLLNFDNISEANVINLLCAFMQFTTMAWQSYMLSVDTILYMYAETFLAMINQLNCSKMPLLLENSLHGVE